MTSDVLWGEGRAERKAHTRPADSKEESERDVCDARIGHGKTGKIEAFEEACRLNHESSIREPGNLRFDILQSADDPTKFVLYEAYRTQKDAAEHKGTAHYLAWRDAVADWMAEPRKGVAYTGLYPSGES